MSGQTIEPWLRGTLEEFDAVRRQVLHALELALEDSAKWVSGLTDEEVNARPFGLAPVAFHLRHMARSLDRLLTYAEGRQLTPEQMTDLRSELEGGAAASEVLREFEAGVRRAMARVSGIAASTFEEMRGVGRDGLPSTVGGLVVHCPEHTQRHVGQMITTAQVMMGIRVGGISFAGANDASTLR